MKKFLIWYFLATIWITPFTFIRTPILESFDSGFCIRCISFKLCYSAFTFSNLHFCLYIYINV